MWRWVGVAWTVATLVIFALFVCCVVHDRRLRRRRRRWAARYGPHPAAVARRCREVAEEAERITAGAR